MRSCFNRDLHHYKLKYWKLQLYVACCRDPDGCHSFSLFVWKLFWKTETVYNSCYKFRFWKREFFILIQRKFKFFIKPKSKKKSLKIEMGEVFFIIFYILKMQILYELPATCCTFFFCYLWGKIVVCIMKIINICYFKNVLRWWASHKWYWFQCISIIF